VEVGGNLRRDVEAEVAQVVELEVDANLVVLQRNERERQARVAAEPELQRDVQRVLRGAVEDLGGGVGLATGAVVVARLAALDKEVRELGHVANHLGIAALLARLLRELVPDVEPLAIVLVNALAANLKLDGLDEVVADVVEPAELGARAVRRLQGNRRQRGLQVNTVDEVTVALDSARHTLAKARGAIERVLNGLHGEVRVAAVHDLKEGNLRVAREVNILRTISDELH